MTTVGKNGSSLGLCCFVQLDGLDIYKMLPYDGTPPPEERIDEPSGLDRPLGEYTEPSALDRPLDDYQPNSNEVPEHVQSLMGRMSKGKVYLLEESPAVIIMDGEERIRRDPVSCRFLL
jgi:hypothetical protein